MASKGKLIGTFGPPIDVEVAGPLSNGLVTLVVRHSKINVGQDFTFRDSDGKSLRVSIIGVAGDAAIGKVTGSL